MSMSLNVVALISGGKDSLYSLLHCIQNGHKVVALANIYPNRRKIIETSTSDLELKKNRTPEELPNDALDDIDSFMYQTVGHGIIPLYSSALDLPLYRQVISGSAVQSGRYYDSSKPTEMSLDETEDLIPLLQEVVKHHPNVNAISSGAILSTYQRTRIESIATRLGLIPLSFLWQYPALPPPHGRADSVTGLLDDMAAADCDARIIKIASGGIKEGLLGSNVTDEKTKSQMTSGLRKFFPEQEFWLRGAILGEGGEYETLAVNGPRQVWKKRIELLVGHPSSITGTGGVTYLQTMKASLIDQTQQTEKFDRADLVRTPVAFDLRFEELQNRILGQVNDFSIQREGGIRAISRADISPSIDAVNFECTYHVTRTHITVTNIVSMPEAQGADAVIQMESIVNRLKKILTEITHSQGFSELLTTSSIVSSIFLISGMSDFAALNRSYSSLFISGEPNPPVRVTFACKMPKGIKVSLNVILAITPCNNRRGLHVQSRSYWAPANIGPYSQAICEPLDAFGHESVNIHDAQLTEVVHVAGQIPLVPSSMEIYEASFLEQSLLSLQHLWRVGQERGVDAWPYGVAFLDEAGQITEKVTTAYKVWSEAHRDSNENKSSDAATSDSSDEEPEFDAWDLKYNRFDGGQLNIPRMTTGEHLHRLPNPSIFTNPNIPPFLAAEVSSLPRNAPIEWWSLGLGNLPKASSPSKPALSTSSQGTLWYSTATITYNHSNSEELELSEQYKRTTNIITIQIHDAEDSALHHPSSPSEILDWALPKDTMSANQTREVVHGTAFVSDTAVAQRLWSAFSSDRNFSLASLALVPCNSLWGAGAPTCETRQDRKIIRRLAIAIIVRVEIYPASHVLRKNYFWTHESTTI